MIFTQTIFPADYLYAFTVSGCWMDLIIRYMELGIFQLGTPRLEIPEGHHHGVNHEDHERNSGNHDSSDKEHELVETETLSIESSDLTSSSNSIISKIADEKLS
uniref:Uncharacterized protein n=1 Tax=Rhabditophanes sp. KR3021 TaxID=114890 RepID=A0AC35U6X8_9BILA